MVFDIKIDRHFNDISDQKLIKNFIDRCFSMIFLINEMNNITIGPINPDKIVRIGEMSGDTLYVKNINSGQIPTNQIYPFVFDVVDKDFGEIYYKSQSFYKILVECINNNISSPAIPPQYLVSFLVGIRDAFIASELHMFNFVQKNTAIIVMKSLEYVIGHIATNFITVSPYPTKTHTLLRFMELSSEDLREFDVYYAIHPKGYRYVFVDPVELSYHNFDPILDFSTVLRLDDMSMDFYDRTHDCIKKNCGSKINRNGYKYSIHDVYPWIKRFKIDNDLNDRLLQIDSWNLYSSMLNTLSRGGKRLLFKSDDLAQILEKIVRPLMAFEDIHSINSVFRYNNFVPSDNKFTSHYDTPYRSLLLASRYTLIIYLTEGFNENKPILAIDSASLEGDSYKIPFMEKATGIIFHQKYEHEGNPYIDTNKIFIRTEIICCDESYSVDQSTSDACKAFNSACYFTTQSTVLSELNTYTTHLFNLSTQLHFGLPTKDFCIPILIKRFNNICFATNGFDYWFSLDVIKIDAAKIILIDFFNGFTKNNKQKTVIIKAEYNLVDLLVVYDKIKYYQNLCQNKNKPNPNPNFSNGENLNNINDNHKGWNIIDYEQSNPNLSMNTLEKTGIYDIADIPSIYFNYLDKLGENLDNSLCCDFGQIAKFYDNSQRSPTIYNSLKLKIRENYDNFCSITKRPQESVISEHEFTQNRLIDETIHHSLILMDSDIYINIKDMIDTGSTISFKNTGFEKQINFASCWCHDESSFDFAEGFTKHTNTKTYSLPKINYVVENNGIRFNICYFRNMFSDACQESSFKLPTIESTKLSDYI